MNEMTKTNQGALSTPVTAEAQVIGNAAQEDAGFERLLKFKKGKYECDSIDIPIGMEYIAHCVGWSKAWIKFLPGPGGKRELVDRKIYRVAEGRRPPEREELDMIDKNAWPPGLNGQPSDPWVYQHLLPMEDQQGELVVFVTSSVGGRRAVADLCKSYARRVARTGVSAQPIIKLEQAVMPTTMYGDVPRPHFEIIGWNEAAEGVRNVVPPDTLKNELDDDIPF